MKTFYRDFLRPTREGVPDQSFRRGYEFAVARKVLGHNVIRTRMSENYGTTDAKDIGYRIYFSAGPINASEAIEARWEKK